MKSTTINLDMDRVANALEFATGQGQDRDRGDETTHVSWAVNELARTTGAGTWYDPAVPPTEWQTNIMALGRALEVVMGPVVAEWAAEQGLVYLPKVYRELEGRTGSLDGEVVSLDVCQNPSFRPAPETYRPHAVVEMKSRNAQAKDIKGEWRYMKQGAAYCWMAGTTTLWMPVMYLPRSYPPDVFCLLHVVEFSPVELAENWQSIVAMRGVKV